MPNFNVQQPNVKTWRQSDARVPRRRLSQDQRGAVAIVFAASVTVLLGFAGLAVDVSYWQASKSTLQGVADAAAVTAALSVSKGNSQARTRNEVLAIANAAGLSNGVNGVSITYSSPPSAGAHAGDTSFQEVVISQQQPTFFSPIVLPTTQTVSARAVASFNSGVGCVYALNAGTSTDITASGSAVVNLSDCSLYDNSSGNKPIDISGSARITAKTVYFVAPNPNLSGITPSSGANVKTNQPAVVDPYAARAIPSYSGCDVTNPSFVNGSVLNPNKKPVYVICGNGINVSGISVTASPGVYILDGGSLTISGGGTVSGSGVSFILTSSSGAKYGSITVSGGSSLNISAPTVPATANGGIALWIDKRAPANTLTISASNGSITGAIYAPNSAATYSGSSSSAACTQLVVSTVTFSGSATFKGNCIGTGVAGSSASPLVE